MILYVKPWYRKLHADTQDWRRRVALAGGSVSRPTAQAVDTFVRGIIADGLRDRFYRLNLFAGDGILSALVPLYRGPVSGGAVYGFEYDQNIGPFASEDYSTSLGLSANGTTKYLNTGLSGITLPSAYDIHIANWVTRAATVANTFNVGWGSTGGVLQTGIGPSNPATTYWFWNYPNSGSAYVAKTLVPLGFMVGSVRTSGSGGAALLVNTGSESTSTSGANRTLVDSLIPIFARRLGTLIDNRSNAALGMYSIGRAMNTSQSLAYRARAQALASALGRAS